MGYVLGVEVTLSSLITALALIAIAATVAGYFIYTYRQSGSQARDRALQNWKELAESEQAKNIILKAENTQLKSEVQDYEQLRNDFAKFVLRTNAREEHYQRCINRLELKLGMEPTDFNDPTHHITESPGR